MQRLATTLDNCIDCGFTEDDSDRPPFFEVVDHMKKNTLTLISLTLCSALLLSSCGIADLIQKKKAASYQKFSQVFFDYFDTVTTIVGYEEEEAPFQETCAFIEQELAKYDALFDNYNALPKETSMYSINRDAGKAPVTVDAELIELFEMGKEIYALTGGMTDFAMGSVFSIWHEYREEASFDPALAAVPSMEELTEAARHCNIDDVIIDKDSSTIYYADPLLKCDVGAYAKGYAIERITQELIARDKQFYSINVGGNVRTIGQKPDGTDWNIAIQNPDLAAEDAYAEVIHFHDLALATSGSYQRFYYVGDQLYHHIIHPETLFPENNYLSVSVLNTDAGIGDALSTALFNMSLEDGQALVSSLEKTEAMWILPDGSKVYSNGFESYIKK